MLGDSTLGAEHIRVLMDENRITWRGQAIGYGKMVGHEGLAREDTPQCKFKAMSNLNMLHSQEEEQTGELTYQANSAPMETVHKEGAIGTTCPEGNGKDKDGSTTDEQCDPRGPPSDLKSLKEWLEKTSIMPANSRGTSTIIPDADGTPQRVPNVFFDILPHLRPILKKDSAGSFLRFLNKNGRDMTLGYIIKPEALNEPVIANALRCAKVVLEGKSPELHGFRADPNCMTQFGFFPLHRAAEMFSMI
ncbi:Ankyrin repeat domain-containing protein 31 [Hordeum vulgare]|nr:Ankyrin repeat domain-containing protein 31 [Hordeum vulgare]